MSDEACSIPSENINFAINVSIYVFILFCFLSLFFIFYVSKLSKNAIENEIDEIIEFGIVKGVDKLSDNGKRDLKTVLQKIPFDNFINAYSKEDDVVKNNNNWLIKVTIIVNVFLIILIIASSTLLYSSCNQCVPVKEILSEKFFIFGLIGIIQILFFKYVISKYIPIKPSTFFVSLVESMKKHISK